VTGVRSWPQPSANALRASGSVRKCSRRYSRPSLPSSRKVVSSEAVTVPAGRCPDVTARQRDRRSENFVR